MTDVSPSAADVYSAAQVVIAYASATVDQQCAWGTGTATGGYHQDGTPSTGASDPAAGYYPLNLPGNAGVLYIACPAKIATQSVGPPGPTGVLTADGATRFSPAAAGAAVTLPVAVAATDILDLDLNGQRQWEGLDFTVSGSTLTFTGSGVQPTDIITFRKLSVVAP